MPNFERQPRRSFEQSSVPNQPEENEVIQYKEIEGMRFDTRLDQETIDKRVNVHTNSYFAQEAKKSSDLRTYLEHASFGGTAYYTNKPLTPYAVISGKMTPEQAKEERQTSGLHGDVGGLLNVSEFGLSAENDLRTVRVSVEGHVHEEFVKFLEEAVKNSFSKNGTLSCRFTDASIDQTGQLTMPYLSKIDQEELPVDLQGKVRLKEYIVDEEGDLYQVIDEKGWRFDKKPSEDVESDKQIGKD